MPHTLTARNVSKKIGEKELLCDVSLELTGGSVYGFTGENGSGKTMLFRMLCGLIRPTQGQVLLDGVDIRQNRTAKIGVIIENTEMWSHLTGFENLLYLSELNHYISKEQVALAMRRVGLEPDNRLPVKKYSLGMKQRLVIAQAVMEEPDFLFLDEPTNAIDKGGVELVRTIIAQEADRGAVVLLASHMSQDISALCKEVYYMEDGHCSRGGVGDAV